MSALAKEAWDYAAQLHSRYFRDRDVTDDQVAAAFEVASDAAEETSDEAVLASARQLARWWRGHR